MKALSLTRTTADRLVHRYGTDVRVVVGYLVAAAAREPIVAGEPELRGELDYQREHEMAIYSADHMLRRWRLGLYHGTHIATA